MNCFSKFKGGFYLSMVIVIWVSSAVIIQTIFTSSSVNFNKPLFLTYYCTNWFMVYLVPLFFRLITLRRAASTPPEHRQVTLLSDDKRPQ